MFFMLNFPWLFSLQENNKRGVQKAKSSQRSRILLMDEGMLGCLGTLNHKTLTNRECGLKGQVHFEKNIYIET